jgi:tRNA A-37 threonylcarbamoyl transferase component Bud32
MDTVDENVVPPTIPDEPVAVAATGYGWHGSIIDDEEVEDELVGETLGGTYVIERVLGEGGMGRVYLAHHTRIKRKRFAIKSLHPEYVRRPDIVRRFRREAEAAAAITSDHVVGVYDVDEDHLGRPYIVAELLEGVELGDLLEQQGRLSIDRAVDLGLQLCRALTAAHDKGVVHRDMKPENVFMTGDPRRPTVKVLDFGISRLDDGSEGGTALTKAGTVMGTPAYMPPEQARGTPVDHRADIYSVGAILYRALTGQVPFDRNDPMATVAAVLTEEPPRPRSIAPEIPGGLEIAIQRAMAKDREDRFSSMQEFESALVVYAGDPALHATIEAPAAGPGGRAQLLMLGVTAMLFVVLGGLGAGGSLVTVLRGYGPTTLELVIVLVTLGLGLATPTVLGLRAVKLRLWDDSAKVQSFVGALRRPATAALVVYGAGALLAGLADFVFSSPRPGWPGWPAVWFATACVAGGYAHLQKRARPALDLSLGLLTIVGVALAVAGLRGGPTGPSMAVPAGTTSAPAPSASAAPAPPDELAKAKAEGVEGLERLRAKYPRDKSVLRMLLLTHASSTKGLEQAMLVVEQLHAVDPRALLDPLVEHAIVEAASGPGPGRTRALSLMAEKMGSRGPDLLWDLAHGKSAAKADAAAVLARPDVQARGTPALQVAAALKAAKGCVDKAALLERVESDGDQRAVAVLQPLTRGRSSGCGLLRLQACPAACPNQAAAMKAAIAAVKAREP